MDDSRKRIWMLALDAGWCVIRFLVRCAGMHRGEGALCEGQRRSPHIIRAIETDGFNADPCRFEDYGPPAVSSSAEWPAGAS